MKTWTNKNIETLKQIYPKGNLIALAKVLNKTVPAVKSKAKLLGIKRTINVRKIWTDKETETMSECYADTPTPTLAEWFDRSILSVYQKAALMGLNKSEAFIKSEASGRWSAANYNQKGKAHQFKKGQTPPNKGKKQNEYMTAEAIERSANTRYKKGNMPHNSYAQESGVIVERKDKRGVAYKMIKLAHAKWLHLHVHLWQQANGIVPKGMLVVFKDGNTMNCTLENLELIDRAENMRRNSHINLPADVQGVIHAKIAVTRQLNKLKTTQLPTS